MMGNVIEVSQKMEYVFRVPSVKKKMRATGIEFKNSGYIKQNSVINKTGYKWKTADT
jgi:hypothetical protein